MPTSGLLPLSAFAALVSAGAVSTLQRSSVSVSLTNAYAMLELTIKNLTMTARGSLPISPIYF